MTVGKKQVAIGLVAGAAGVVAGVVAGSAIALRRWRKRPDLVVDEDFGELPGTIHRVVPASDGGEVHVVERGEGRPFLLVHGVTETVFVWHYLMRDLVEAGYRVVALDIRGHGRSRAGDRGYTLDAMAEDVLETMVALDLRDAVAVGHSMGGMVLMQLLGNHPELVPERIARLVLVATSASPVVGSGLPAAAAAAIRGLTPIAGRGHIRASAGGRGRVHQPGDLAAVYTRLAFGKNPSPTHVEMLRAATSSIPVDILGHLLATLLELDVRPVLSSIKAPTMVVVGSRDLLTPVWHARLLAQRIPGAVFHVLPGCGHMVMYERPQELARLLLDFARR